MAATVNFGLKTLAVVTGASRGIGRTIAVELARRLQNDSVIVLIARSMSGLEHTKDLMKAVNKTAIVATYVLDLEHPDMNLYDEIFVDNQGLYENGIIFHNAGTLGTLDSTSAYTDLGLWQKFFNVNLFSTSLLNAAFLKHLRANSAKHIYVVNITSLCGSQPFKNLAMYGSGKAARNIFFKVLAEEETDVFVLNYSPGPVDTDMVADIRQNVKDQDIKQNFDELVEKKTILTPEITICKLMGILEAGKYKSGDLIDFYDRL